MSDQLLAVILSFLLLAIYILLPLIPAVYIYKRFPSSTASAEGQLSSIKFKAGGAFAAYVITVFLGYFIVQNIIGLINNTVIQTWEVSSRVKFVDEKGNELKDVNHKALIDLVEINQNPDIYLAKEPDLVKFRIHCFGRESVINYSFMIKDSFEPRTFDISKDSESVKVDFANREIDLGTISLFQIKQNYNPKDTIKSSNDGPPIHN